MLSRRSSYQGYPVEAQGKAAIVDWDPGIISYRACSGAWTSCAAAYPNSPLSGSFAVYSQASSIIVYGWKVNGSQPIVALGGVVTNELDTHWQPSEDEINMFRTVLWRFLPPPATLDPSWVQFSVTFPSLSNGGEATKLTLTDGSVTSASDEAFTPGLNNPALIFQNLTIFYAPVGSGPASDRSSTTIVASETTPLSVPIATSHTKRPSTVHWQLAMEILLPLVLFLSLAVGATWAMRRRRHRDAVVIAYERHAVSHGGDPPKHSLKPSAAHLFSSATLGAATTGASSSDAPILLSHSRPSAAGLYHSESDNASLPPAYTAGSSR